MGVTTVRDKRSGKIVIVSHCILNVHSLEDGLAIYPGLEEEIIKILIEKGVGIFQIPCPEMMIMGINRLPMPKDPYEHPRLRSKFRELAMGIVRQLKMFRERGYEITAVVGAEGSPTCGISKVGRWRDPNRRGRFPDDVVFVDGMGVFIEELKKLLEDEGIYPEWIGIPGKSIRSIDPASFNRAINKLKEIL